MRLAILERGHSIGSKLLFAIIRTASRQPVLDIIKLVRYRPDFYGKPMGAVTHEVMRGPSAWSVGDRELMAAVVAKANQCAFCTAAHAAVARGAYRSDEKVVAALSDQAATLDEPLRSTLQMLRKLSKERQVQASDMRASLDAGATREQILDALAVSFAFNTVARLADAFGFSVPTTEAMNSGAKYLLARGYR
jgi:AhpD family alkylhydroperoxidase